MTVVYIYIVSNVNIDHSHGLLFLLFSNSVLGNILQKVRFVFCLQVNQAISYRQ